MKMTLATFTVHTTIIDNEWANGGPYYAVIEIDEEIARKIVRWSDLVKQEDAYELTEFSYLPDWYTGDPDDEDRPEEGDVTGEAVTMHVKAEGVYWEGYVKHTSDRFESDDIPLTTIKELLQVKGTPLEDLPLLINTINTEEAKTLLKNLLTN
jgi:hypothetical protein